MVSHTKEMDSTHFHMGFADILCVVKPIFRDFDFFLFQCTRLGPTQDVKFLKPPHIVKKHLKYTKIVVFCVKKPQKNRKEKWLKAFMPYCGYSSEFNNRFLITLRHEKFRTSI